MRCPGLWHKGATGQARIMAGAGMRDSSGDRSDRLPAADPVDLIERLRRAGPGDVAALTDLKRRAYLETAL